VAIRIAGVPKKELCHVTVEIQARRRYATLLCCYAVRYVAQHVAQHAGHTHG
jgi:hypothetical protein